MTSTSTIAPRQFTDAELLKRAVIMAWSDIADGDEPRPERYEAACFGFTEAFGGLVDPLSERLKDRAMAEAAKYGLVDRNAGECDAEMMDLFMQAVEQAFWLGLTRGRMIIDDRVHFPYRLFPEQSGIS